MVEGNVRVDASGRVVIPRNLRDALGIVDGGELRLTVQNGELRATTRQSALRRIRAELRRAGSDAPSMTAALAEERRAEARRGLHDEQASLSGSAKRD